MLLVVSCMSVHHIPVLLNEVLRVLEPKENEIFIDGTLGGGGHAEKILERLGAGGKLIGIDADESAIKKAEEKIGGDKRVIFVHGNYADIPKIIADMKIERVDGIFLDLGFSSLQIDGGGRGFSFTASDEPLDMRYGKSGSGISARSIINSWNKDELARIFRKLGEERYAGRIARRIVEIRKRAPIETAGALADAVLSAIPRSRKLNKRVRTIHPATRVFQAVRIAVNRELENLETALLSAPDCLAPGGRLAVISFHSLEDRIVKNHFRMLASDGIGEILTKKPVMPSFEEIKANSRSRPAKLRAFRVNNIFKI